MKQLERETIAETLQSAVRMTEGLPEKFQQAAFKEIVRFSLERQLTQPVPAPNLATASNVVSATRNEGNVTTADESSTAAVLSARDELPTTDELPAPHVVKEQGNRAQQTIWAVIRIHGRGDEVDVPAIQEEIKKALATKPQRANNTSRTLRRLTPKYVNRHDREEGQGYSYTPTEHAFEIFKDLDK